jgi:hypothetical protein
MRLQWQFILTRRLRNSVNDLERLARLHQMGALSADEFNAAKRQCLKMPDALGRR